MQWVENMIEADYLDGFPSVVFHRGPPVTNPVLDHYENLLGPVYSWMVGDIEAATVRADAELDGMGLPSRADGFAVDLGAGFGMHSLPLARRGYQVMAVDSYEPLLNELEARAGSLAIRTVNADLLEFSAHVAQPATVILCMGDTLTHLPDAASVKGLVHERVGYFNARRSVRSDVPRLCVGSLKG